MTVIKRNGTEVAFDITKIIAAVSKANDSVGQDARMTPMQIRRIAEFVELSCQKMNRAPSVEEIQDLVEYQIMAHGAYEVAKSYITYRYTRSLVRKSNTTDDKILSLIECCNEEAKQENSNKNPVVNSTQRDYMAGEVSRDLSERILLPALREREKIGAEARPGIVIERPGGAVKIPGVKRPRPLQIGCEQGCMCQTHGHILTFPDAPTTAPCRRRGSSPWGSGRRTRPRW